MATTENKKDLIGFDVATANIAETKGTTLKDVEYDLTTALLSAAAFRTSEEAITEVEIKRNGKYYFTLHVHPISDSDSRKARKKATTYMPNPNGRKLPPIEKDFNSAIFHSNLIYAATTAEDQAKIWNNRAVMDKYDIVDPIDTVDTLLAVGEKLEIVDVIMDISGLNPDVDEVEPEDYAKN